jgi:uncharacterized membrane protein YeiH
MDIEKLLILILQIAGAIAYGICGATAAIRRKMDVFWVVLLGTITASGGGMIRDIILGITPPIAFMNPVIILMPAATSIVVFMLVYFNRSRPNSRDVLFSETVSNVVDSVGLAVFTVISINVAVSAGLGDRILLTVITGTVGAVGGGFIRDLLTGYTPALSQKRLFVSASVAGGFFCLILMKFLVSYIAMYIGFAVIVLIRFLGLKYCWSLPKALLVQDGRSDKA